MPRFSDLFHDNVPVAWVIGGAGGLGSHVCELLLSLGVRVICIDNWKVGVEKNIPHLLENKRFELVAIDPVNPLPELARPSYIFYILPQTSEDDPLGSYEKNALGIRNALEAAGESGAKFLLATSASALLRPVRRIVEQGADARGVDYRIVTIAYLYGPRMPLDTLVGVLFRDASHGGYSNLGVPLSTRIKPLFIEDAARGILSAMFGMGTRKKEFSFSTAEISLEGFRDRIKTIADMHGNVGEEGTGEEEFKISGESLKFTPTPLDVGIGKTLAYFAKEKKSLPRGKISAPTRARNRRLRVKLPKIVNLRQKPMILGILALVLVAATPFLLSLLGAGAFVLGVGEAKRGNFEMSGRAAGASQAFFTASNKIFRRASDIPVFGEILSPFGDLSYSGLLAGDTLIQATNVGEKAKHIISGVFGSGEVSVAELNSVSRDLEELAVNVGFLEAQFKGSKLLNGKESYFSFPSLFRISQILKESPDLLGFDGPKTYLVLFQNNMELRPTGGFIGSFGLLTFERGRLADVQIHDVYEADGQLRGHVEPPAKLKEYLGEASWYLRDSNWSPDFPTTASRAEWFLDKEMGKHVDGVIAVDLEFAKRLLGVVGEVEVRDFGEKVTPLNFYEVTQKRAEENFFPGSTQKADFLTALNRTLIEEVSAKASTKAVPMAQVLESSLAERHALIYLHNKEAQSAVRELGWDGGLKNAQCQMLNGQCKEDYLMVVDANIGVNKGNYYLSRSFLADVSISRDSIFHKLLITYSNRAKSQTDQFGKNARYKSYLRVYVPKGAVGFTASLLNPQSGEKLAILPDKSTEQGKDAYGILLEVSPGRSSQLVFSWEIPTNFSGKENSLSFLWQKQPGIIDDPVVLRFHPEKNVKLELAPVPSLTGRAGLGYTTVFTKDLEVEAIWTDQN